MADDVTYTSKVFNKPPVAIPGGFFYDQVDVRNETASNHYKQTQMGGLGDGSIS